MFYFESADVRALLGSLTAAGLYARDMSMRHVRNVERGLNRNITYGTHIRITLSQNHTIINLQFNGLLFSRTFDQLTGSSNTNACMQSASRQNCL